MGARGTGDVLTGRKYGRLTVGEMVPYPPGEYAYYWICTCECGTVKKVLAKHLKKGLIRSCGCYCEEVRSMNNRTHGAARNNTITQEYEAWQGMRSRCRDAKDPAFHRYGGRGIAVCSAWDDYRNFLQDMGAAPSRHHSVGRVNNNGNYEPSNCRWETPKQQGRNTSRTVLNPTKVQEIKLRAARGEKHGAIARDYGCSRTAIWCVVQGKTWGPDEHA